MSSNKHRWPIQQKNMLKIGWFVSIFRKTFNLKQTYKHSYWMGPSTSPVFQLLSKRISFNDRLKNLKKWNKQMWQQKHICILLGLMITHTFYKLKFYFSLLTQTMPSAGPDVVCRSIKHSICSEEFFWKHKKAKSPWRHRVYRASHKASIFLRHHW